MDTQISFSLKLEQPPLQQPRITGWRLKYTGEGGNDNPLNMPAVAPSFNVEPVLFDERLQLLSWELMRRLNPTITRQQWRSVYRFDRAFTNGNGFDAPDDVRADYVNRLDLGAPLPKLMKALICSGSLYQGVEQSEYLIMHPGVHAIDVYHPADIDEVIARRWYFLAVSWTGSGGVHFPQGNGGIVAIPFILRAPTSYPKMWFQRWDDIVYPDPLKMYL